MRRCPVGTPCLCPAAMRCPPACLRSCPPTPALSWCAPRPWTRKVGPPPQRPHPLVLHLSCPYECGCWAPGLFFWARNTVEGGLGATGLGNSEAEPDLGLTPPGLLPCTVPKPVHAHLSPFIVKGPYVCALLRCPLTGHWAGAFVHGTKEPRRFCVSPKAFLLSRDLCSLGRRLTTQGPRELRSLCPKLPGGPPCRSSSLGAGASRRCTLQALLDPGHLGSRPRAAMNGS